MNTCRCASCCSSHAVYYRELQYCPCEAVHYPRLPPIISPIRTRPVVFKSSIAPVTLPRSLLIRETERNVTAQKIRQNAHSQTKLKFGIDSILGKESNDVRQASAEEQFQHLGEFVKLIFKWAIICQLGMMRETMSNRTRRSSLV